MYRSLRKNITELRFTLLELLIVIAIIAILASLLLPGLGKSKDLVRMTACSNNLRQTGSAFNLYNNDYNEHYPQYSYGTYASGGGSWITRLVRTCGYIPGKVFVCPKRNSSYPEMYKWQSALSYPVTDTVFWSYPDYGYNYTNFGMKSGDYSCSAKVNMVRRPSGTLIVTESARGGNRTQGGSYIEPYASNGFCPWPTHNGICNVLWADGHIYGVKGGSGANEASAMSLRYGSGAIAGGYNSRPWVLQ